MNVSVYPQTSISTDDEEANCRTMHFETAEWIKSDPSNQAVFDTLVTFLENASTDSANLKQLVASTTATLTSFGMQHPDAEECSAQSRILFAILLTIVQQLDYAAAQQDHLVLLVLDLRNVTIPATVSESIDEDAIDSNMNHDLSNLINVWSNFERDASLHPRREDRPDYRDYDDHRPPWRQLPGRYLTAAQWTSLNAFLARLHVAAPDVSHLDLRGLFAMIEALEQPLSPMQLEDAVPAAACWILFAGEKLRTNDVSYAYRVTTSKRLPWSKGELWQGQHAFNQERWHFWMQRFSAIADRADVDQNTRLMALRAFQAGSQILPTGAQR